jgi:hypothetical protein
VGQEGIRGAVTDKRFKLRGSCHTLPSERVRAYVHNSVHWVVDSCTSQEAGTDIPRNLVVGRPLELGLRNCIIEMLKQYRESCDLYVACFDAQMIQHLMLAKADAL